MQWLRACQRAQLHAENKYRPGNPNHNQVEGENNSDPKVHLKVDAAYPYLLRPTEEASEEIHSRAREQDSISREPYTESWKPQRTYLLL